MKKSEVIAIIKNELDTSDLTGKDLTWVAEHILSKLEDAGMLPPEHLFTNGERRDHYLQEWESENETK